jgi:Ca-activated chloride channel family protein
MPSRVLFPIPIPKKLRGRNPMRFLLALKVLGWILFVIALARPQSSYQQSHRTVDGIDIMMVLDVSASMHAEDLGERSRLDIAKDMMERFVKGRQNDRIGFVMFSGEPYTQAPLTLDYALVLKGIRDATTGILKDGTAIGDGLATSVNLLRSSKAKSKVVVLLTDGDNNLGQIDPATAGELAKGYGVRVYAIAVGREGRVRIPIKQKTPFGNTVTSYIFQDNALNTEVLEKIAAMTQAKFYRVQDEDTLVSVFSEIDRLEKTKVQATEQTKYEERFQTPLRWGFAVLLIEQILSHSLWRMLP